MLCDYARIAAAIQFHGGARAPLDRVALAAHVGLSEASLAQLFQRWSGTSPELFLASLTRSHAQERLARSRAVVQAALRAEAAWSGDVATAAPAEREPGGLTIGWGITESRYGRVGIGGSAQRVCWLEFLPQPEEPEQVLQRLRRTWPQARLEHRPVWSAALCARVFAGDRPALLLGGTSFQREVWRLLMRIPSGAVTSYGVLAAALGRPGASRAVGRAVGSNPIGYLVPCHRVVRQSGGFASYRWGLVRKKALLGYESVQRAVPSPA